jgi:hypothetical protein
MYTRLTLNNHSITKFQFNKLISTSSINSSKSVEAKSAKYENKNILSLKDRGLLVGLFPNKE